MGLQVAGEAFYNKKRRGGPRANSRVRDHNHVLEPSIGRQDGEPLACERKLGRSKGQEGEKTQEEGQILRRHHRDMPKGGIGWG